MALAVLAAVHPHFENARLVWIVVYPFLAGLTGAVAQRHGQHQGRLIERRAILNWLLYGKSPKHVMDVINGIKRGDHEI